MSKVGVRNIDGYNSKHKLKMPYIVVVVDEMSDLMLVSGKEIENYIQKLSQMARAAGIHIIMATQRPSVDVITGTIKANFPTRISFQVSSKIDSRTILGEQGAEQLLGKGDMLFMSSANRIIRIHGPFISEKEIEKKLQVSYELKASQIILKKLLLIVKTMRLMGWKIRRMRMNCTIRHWKLLNLRAKLQLAFYKENFRLAITEQQE